MSYFIINGETKEEFEGIGFTFYWQRKHNTEYDYYVCFMLSEIKNIILIQDYFSSMTDAEDFCNYLNGGR